MSLLLAIYSDWALLLFRLAIGALFIAHGIPKLRHWQGTTAWFHSVGFKPGWLWGTAAGLLEFLGGIALILGFATRWVALLFAAQFLVIIIWKLLRRESFKNRPDYGTGWELDLVLLVSALVLMTVGGGMYGWQSLFFLFAS